MSAAGLALLTLILLPGSVSAGLDTSLTGADSGRTISVAKGAAIGIDLESNASTGYRWIEATKPDPAIVAEDATSGDYVPADSSLVGAAGRQVFRYHGAGDGRTSLVLHYVAPGTNEVGKTFTLTIVVGPAAGMLDTTRTDPPATSTDAAPYGWWSWPLVLLAVAGLLTTVGLRRRLPR